MFSSSSEDYEPRRMDGHLIDGTYELFRHFYAVPASADVHGHEVGAVRGVLTSVLSMIERCATHIGVATDHVVESFRNDLYLGYKTSEGVPQELMSQFPTLEDALQAMGVVVWPMIEFEADDALASAAGTAAKDDRIGQVLICTPDKDLSQCVVGTRVVQLDRRRDILREHLWRHLPVDRVFGSGGRQATARVWFRTPYLYGPKNIPQWAMIGLWSIVRRYQSKIGAQKGPARHSAQRHF
jgi:5'-3' exonuclease